MGTLCESVDHHELVLGDEALELAGIHVALFLGMNDGIRARPNDVLGFGEGSLHERLLAGDLILWVPVAQTSALRLDVAHGV
jgi:hypothetical protein